MTNRSNGTNDHDDARRLREAQEELREVRRRGVRMTPILDRLSKHLADDPFAERLMSALDLEVRRQT